MGTAALQHCVNVCLPESNALRLHPDWGSLVTVVYVCVRVEEVCRWKSATLEEEADCRQDRRQFQPLQVDRGQASVQ